MNPYAHLGQFSFARPAFQPTAPLRQTQAFAAPATTIFPVTTRRRAMLTEPAGQWAFEVRIVRQGGRDISTQCGPMLLTTVQARSQAQSLLQYISFQAGVPSPGPILSSFCSAQSFQDLQRTWAQLPNGSTVSVNASRNGVFRFTVGPYTKGQSIAEGLLPQGFISGPEEQDGGTLGQENGNGNGETMTPDGRTITIRSRGFFPSPFQFAPAPFAYSPFYAAPSFYTFQVMAEQPVSTDQRTLNSWAEALAHAERLYTATPGASRVIVTDQNGQRQVFPGAFAPPFARRGTLVPFSVTRAVTLAGPYGHLGQRPVATTNGAQKLDADLRNYLAGVSAILYAELGLTPELPAITQASDVFTGYTFFTSERRAVDLGQAPLPEPGFPPAPPGSIYVVNVDELVRLGQHIDQQLPAAEAPTVRLIVAPDLAQAETISQIGTEWAIVNAPEVIAAPTERGISPAAIAAGIAAAAVAALLIFS